MKKKKKLIFYTVLAIFSLLLLLFLLPPFMFQLDGIILGEKVDKFERQYSFSEAPGRKRHDYLYFVNIGINQDVKIYQESLNGKREEAFEKICPFIWREKSDDLSLGVYEVEVDDLKYYFVYFSP